MQSVQRDKLLVTCTGYHFGELVNLVMLFGNDELKCHFLFVIPYANQCIRGLMLCCFRILGKPTCLTDALAAMMWVLGPRMPVSFSPKTNLRSI